MTSWNKHSCLSCNYDARKKIKNTKLRNTEKAEYRNAVAKTDEGKWSRKARENH